MIPVKPVKTRYPVEVSVHCAKLYGLNTRGYPEGHISTCREDEATHFSVLVIPVTKHGITDPIMEFDDIRVYELAFNVAHTLADAYCTDVDIIDY